MSLTSHVCEGTFSLLCLIWICVASSVFPFIPVQFVEQTICHAFSLQFLISCLNFLVIFLCLFSFVIVLSFQVFTSCGRLSFVMFRVSSCFLFLFYFEALASCVRLALRFLPFFFFLHFCLPRPDFYFTCVLLSCPSLCIFSQCASLFLCFFVGFHCVPSFQCISACVFDSLMDLCLFLRTLFATLCDLQIASQFSAIKSIVMSNTATSDSGVLFNIHDKQRCRNNGQSIIYHPWYVEDDLILFSEVKQLLNLMLSP